MSGGRGCMGAYLSGMITTSTEEAWPEKVGIRLGWNLAGGWKYGWKRKKGLRWLFRKPLISLVAGVGFEPTIFGL